MKEIELPSGAVLKLGINPFEVSLALKEAIFKEIGGMSLSFSTDVSEIIKQSFCFMVTSSQVKKCMWDCFKKHIYNSGNGDLKIDKDSFEPEMNRQDYETVCMEVAKHELAPFGKQGFVRFSTLANELINALVSK